MKSLLCADEMDEKGNLMKKLLDIIIILSIIILYIIVMFIQMNKEKKELQQRLYKYEMYSAKDTAEIINLIILREYAEKGIDTNSCSTLEIQKFPFIKWYGSQVEKELDSYSYPINISYTMGTDLFGSEEDKNCIYLLSFYLKHDSTARIEYNVGRHRQCMIDLKRDKKWIVTRYINYE